MDNPLALGLIKKFDRAETRRQQYEKDWRHIGDYIHPRKSLLLRKATAGSTISARLYSSTAIKANHDLASAMQGALTNAAIRWFKLSFPFKELNDEPEAAAWLEDVSDRMFLMVQHSNFAAEINEAYLDLGAFGTSATFVDWDIDKARLRFKTITIGEYIIGEGRDGKVNFLGRKYEMTLQQIVDQFGRDNPNLTTRMRSNLDTGSMDERFEILHIIGWRKLEEQDPRTADIDATKRPWAEFYVTYGEGEKAVLFQGGYFEMPWMVARWSKNGNEEFGRGPGHVSLPDVKTLNRARQLKFRHWSKVIDPPMQAVEEGVIGEISMTPSSINYVRDMDMIKPIEVGGQPQVTQVNEAELIQQIKEIFFSDLVNLPPIQGTPMSATEAAQRFELMERKLGPTVGRLKSELLTPTVERIFGMMLRAGFIPPPPASVILFFQQNGKIDMQVEFEGPLERAQRQSDLVAVEKTYASLGPIAQVRPEVLDVLDHDSIAVYVARAAGLPAHFIVPPEQVQQVRQERAEMEAKLQQMQMAESATKSMKAGAGSIRELKQAGVEIPQAQA